jgi:hypothetical protein
MDLFKRLLQPSVIFFGESNGRYPIENRFLMNYNVLQIDWFKNNSIVLEGGQGILLLEGSDDDNPYSASGNDAADILDDGIISRTGDETILDVPRIFFSINESFYESGKFKTPNVINSFIISLLQIGDGEDLAVNVAQGNTYQGKTLTPGVDYFINETFAFYIKDTILEVVDDSLIVDPFVKDIVNKINAITLPDYLNDNAEICLPWRSLNENEEAQGLEYFFDQNKLFENTADIDLSSFYQLFANTILNKTKIDILSTDIKNQMYKTVLEYFANGMSDHTTYTLNLILNSPAKTPIDIVCYSDPSQSSCLDIYKDSMNVILSNMLGDAEFYYDWMYAEDEDGNKRPDELFIKELIYLLNILVSSNYDLSFTKYTKFSCGCGHSINKTTDNYTIINNYKKILDKIRQCELQNNINKIKVIGNSFGSLLPKLQF